MKSKCDACLIRDSTSRLRPHPSIYPTIDPKVHYGAQTFAGKVVLITGASRGIGAEIALQFARAGASLTLVARSQASLDASKDAILRERPSAQVLTFPADVRDVTKTEEAVTATVAKFGCLDILIANAALLRAADKRAFALRVVITGRDSVIELFRLVAFASKDPKGWWDILEVNIRGPYNYIQCVECRMLAVEPHAHAHLVLHSFSVPELLKTKGQVVIVTSAAAQVRFPNASEYCTSKHAINRFAEFVTIGDSHFLYIFTPPPRIGAERYFPHRFAEYPDIKVFSVHPGSIQTDMADEFAGNVPVDSTVGLAAATVLYLTSGKADYLSGRYVSATWDLGEVERDWKEKIVMQNGLVSKLSIPV